MSLRWPDPNSRLTLTGYTYGCNWRAFVAYTVGAGVNFCGCKRYVHFAPKVLTCPVLDNMGVKGFSTGVVRSFYFAFITTGIAAGLTYYLLARFFPQANYVANKGLKFKEWSQDEVEMYAAGKREIVPPTRASASPSVEEKTDLDPNAVNVLPA